MSPQIENSITVLSANCQGLRNFEKRVDVICYFKERNASILCLQDTHLTENDVKSLKNIWGTDVYVSGDKTNSRGVAIFINNNFEYEILAQNKDKNGNYLNLVIKLSSMTINLVSLYGPNNDSPSFFREIKELLNKENIDYNILCGDFNIAMDQEMDTYNYKNTNNPQARKTLLEIISEYELSDIYRKLNPTSKRFTWRRRNPVKQARLDLFLASTNLLDLTKKCNINSSYRSDHSAIELELIISKFKRGKGLWKFNSSLLESPEYIKLINKVIDEEKLKYALPVYNPNFLKANYTKFEMTIDDDLFLETLILRIRGETIKFSTMQKKALSTTEKQLIEDIETLEHESTGTSHNQTLLSDKKAELENLRIRKTKGQLVRTRMQWLKDGERPSKFLSNLENKNFIEKTIKKVKLDDGNNITQQEKILGQIQQYYSRLFENKDHLLENVNLEELGIQRQGNSHEEDIGTLLTVEEIGLTLKRMKPNKTPGIDGIMVEFLKVFWRQLKYFITNALNCGFLKGRLSVSLRQCIITCLPKPNKDRSLLKNWRPISLLSVIYKLASGSISERFKKTLNNIISSCQTGFISGRYISDSTRLIYDLLHATDHKGITGLLMLIDFEKAFDSLSWRFLYKALNFFGYSKNFLKWIKLFNTDITAYVVQCGFLSKPISIQRGCRQGDPISAYLFLIGAEVLTRLIQNNNHIQGIKIENLEFKMTQFADDTTLIMDGSQHSLQSALNTIEIYGSMSGLKMNKEKTKVIWIGRKRHSKEKLDVSVKLEWGSTKFTLLGIELSTNLSDIMEQNYQKALKKN